LVCQIQLRSYCPPVCSGHDLFGDRSSKPTRYERSAALQVANAGGAAPRADLSPDPLLVIRSG
jgi:hypothetical protein